MQKGFAYQNAEVGLEEIYQLDPVTGKNFISLRASCAWSPADKCFLPSWDFLNAARAEMVGRGARRTKL